MTTILGSSMAFIDGTVVNVALPAIQADLGATVAEVQWVVEAYALFLAALVLLGGALGDRYGRRSVYVAGVTLFALASAWCGLAPHVSQLVAARAIQGVGAALLVPGSLAIIGAHFRDDERGRAIGTWAGFTAITSALGPVLGGWLVQHVSWRAVFFVNLPLAVLVVVLAFWRVPESRAEGGGGRLDWWGALVATLGLGLITYGLVEAGSLGLTHPTVLATLFGSIAFMGLFLALEARSRSPMVPLRLFNSSDFSGANLLTLLLYTALGGVLFFLPLNLIQVQGYTPTAAGAALLPFILIISVLGRWSGGLVARFGGKAPLVAGPTIAAIGLALFALPGTGGSYWTTFFPAVVMLGLGMAIAIAPLTTVVMGAVGANHVGVASGINNSVARLGGLLGVALFGIVILASFNRSLDVSLTTIDLSPTERQIVDAQRVQLAGAQPPEDISPAVRSQLTMARNEAFVSGFRAAMLIAAALALASAVSAWLMIGGGRPGGREETGTAFQ